MPIWVIIFATTIYTLGLFYVAWRGDKAAQDDGRKPSFFQYSLALAVYCTSWTYFGAVGTAASSGWDYLWILAGPAIVFLFLPSLIRRIGDIVERENITSLSDFLSARYGKSRNIAVLATFAAVMGSLPYISLQLKSVGMSFSALAGLEGQSNPANETVFLVSLALAVFAILFGARQADATQNNPGLMRVLSLEAIIKLLALLAVAVLSVNLLGQKEIIVLEGAQNHFADYSLSGRAITILFLSMAAIICLPRQFHVAMIERQSKREVQIARFMFPVYLLITAVVVVPITLAGLLVLNSDTSPDLFVLQIPLSQGDGLLALFVFLGGFSAATSMVIVSTIALSTMITNDIIFPIFFDRNPESVKSDDHGRQLVFIRRATIIGIVLLAYGYFRLAQDSGALARIGLLSFAAAAQFAPALMGGVFWRNGKYLGAFWGITLGISIWIYTLFMPALIGADTIAAWVPEFMHPHALFGMTFEDSLTHGVVWSIGVNLLAYIIISIFSGERLRDRVQAIAFTNLDGSKITNASPVQSTIPGISPDGLKALASRFLSAEAVEHSFLEFTKITGQSGNGDEHADWALIQHTEKLLAKAIGASSARVIIASVVGRRDVDLDDILTIIDQTTQSNRFDQHMIQATLESVSQGISVIDNDLKLVAWNGVYVELFQYPSELMKVGTPIKELIEYNAKNGWIEAENTDATVRRREQHMRSGKPHHYERQHIDGRYIRIDGSPMAGGGYVTTFTDVTDDKIREQALIDSNQTLEERVKERTQELEALTIALDKAREEAVGANLSKTRFLAAASHDLLQPLNAARLFLGAMDVDDKNIAMVNRVDQSIRSADELLKGLLDISRLDHASVEANIESVSLNSLFNELANENMPLAKDVNLDFRVSHSNLVVKADQGFLVSILRNFLSNARRYTEQGGYLIGARRQGMDQVRIEIWDTGPGIDSKDSALIFEEFQKLQDMDNTGIRGSGLGLSICQRLADLMGAEINLKSTVGKGSVFSITLPRDKVELEIPKLSYVKKTTEVEKFSKLNVLCVDDELSILQGMKALLEKWDCNVTICQTGEEAIDVICNRRIDVIVADYQLGEHENGLEVIEHLRHHLDVRENVCLLTAIRTTEIAKMAANDNVRVMNKPASPTDIQAFLSECAKRL